MNLIRGTSLSRLFSERVVRVESRDKVKYLRISPVVQAIVLVCSLSAVTYVFALSVLVGIEFGTRHSAEDKDELIHATYQQRIDELTSSSERMLASAATDNERNRLVFQQLGTEKGLQLQAVAKQRELERNVAVLEERLAGLTIERNGLQSEVEHLQSRVVELSGRVDEQLDTEQLQNAVARTLDVAVAELNSKEGRIANLEEQVDGLQHELKVQEGQYDFIFRNLEGAVELSLGPMVKALERSGVDLDSLLETVRRRFSNSGGPGGSLSNLERTVSESPHAYRIKALVEDLDRAHFMGLALQKIPVSMPVRSKFRYSSNYGLRKDPFTRKISRHEGVDMVARSGTAIYATADGEVVYAGWKGGFGRVVKIRHIHGFETVYGHLRKIHVKRGQMVSRGDRIGDMGNSGRSTGTHLHYEVRVGGNPKDPKKYLEAGQNVF